MEEINQKISVIDAKTLTIINYLLASAGLEDEAHLLNIKETKYQIEMIKRHDEFQYSHLTKKEREAKVQPIRNSKVNPKIYRNELCPCGSGKKYKRCCFLTLPT